jgi:capsular exopolysaccharide synthesis family protein
MSQETIFKDKIEGYSFAKIIRSYLPFWPAFVLSVTLCLTVAFFKIKKENPVYLATAKALLKDSQKGSDTKVLDALNIFSEKKIVENEIIVLRSRSLMESVVQSLDLYAKVFSEGKFRNSELYGENSPVHFVAVDKSSLIPKLNLPFTVDFSNQCIVVSGKKNYFNDFISIEGVRFKIIPEVKFNPVNLNQTYLVEFNSVSAEAANIINTLRGAPLSYNSTVIDMSLETSVPEKGSDVLKKLFEFYNKAGIEDKNQMATKTLNFIENRLNNVTDQIDSVEKNIESYKAQNGVADLSSQASVYFENIKDFDKSNSLLEMQLQLLNEVSTYVESKSKSSTVVPSIILLDDPILKSLLDQLYQAEFELSKARTTAGEKSDIVVLAFDKVNKIKADIRESISNLKQNYSTQIKSNKNNIAYNQSQFSSVPRKERGLLEISRQLAIKNNIYNYLLQKREETALSSAATVSDIRILENVFSYQPIRPVPKKMYLYAFLIGAAAFFVYVFIIEKLKNKIMFRSDIVKNTNVPIVGEIFQSRTNEKVAVSEGKRTIIAEQFRVLRTNLSFMGLNLENNTILITSGISGEGKSFVSLNLAISLTLTGKKVALMEMDLRKPKLSQILNIERVPGISNYLVNQAELKDIIKPTAFPNLFIVSSGVLPPNPTELISKPEFDNLMHHLKSEFDYVVIDSAPVGPVADSQVLTSFASTNLFVVRHNHTPKAFVQMIDQFSSLERFKNMGLVFNGIKPRGTSFFNYSLGGYGNGYSYGYGEGNGYTYEDKEGYFIDEVTNPGFKSIWNFVSFLKRRFKK